MATTINSTTQLVMQECNGGGRLSTWIVNLDTDDGDTGIDFNQIVGQTTGSGALARFSDGSAANSGVGILSVDGAGTDGLSLYYNDDAREIEFRDNSDGSSGAAAEAIDDLDLVVTIRH